MAVAAGTVAIGVWELAALAAAALGLTFFASPQGQEATREAAREVSEALAKVRPKPAPPPQKKPEPEQKPKPVPPIGGCEKKGCKEEEPEMCPVCGIYPNPTPGVTPAYVTENRVPKDSETNPPLNGYKKTSMVVKGAAVYQRPDKTHVHRDTLHTGKGAEIEVYSKNGTHTGTICPHCGAPRGGPVPNRYLPKN